MANRIMIRVNMITNSVLHATKRQEILYKKSCGRNSYRKQEWNANSHCPPSSAGTLITLTLLSALPEMSRLEVGLKRSVVGGKSWAFNIVSRG
jgi:hypothetical protein